ncbi:tetratricopeptide repeat domain 27 [Crucibulum laeve]|uniref:Tetratricopeptide repeat domain 27 n=1 Tax=Crucibulum laeve TaxID=68775 RepID=A0A5C3MFI2_9AGAR|nr:tetratricopeptide repeat domain 27 [Crucibulum laeve]
MSTNYSLSLLPIEIALLTGKWDKEISDPTNSAVNIAQLVVDGSFRAALTSSLARAVFRTRSNDLERPFSEILNLSISSTADLVQEELLHLALAVACLHAFVQANWTGPDLNIQPLQVLLFDFDATPSITEESIAAKAISELAFGGEPAYHLAQVPAFLRLAQLLLGLPYNHVQTAPWWRLRAAIVHQQVLDELVAIPDAFLSSIDPLKSTFASRPDIVGRLYLEIGLFEHHFSQDKSAAEYFVKAARATGLEYELTGALGKRTKFQETQLSQLVLLAQSRLNIDDDELNKKAETAQNAKEAPKINDGPAARNTNVPETLPLNDDTLLEQTEFTSSLPAAEGSRLNHIDPSSQPPLHPLDQCILLSLCLNVRNTSPLHGLTTEQMAPYVSRVILYPRNWTVHTMALLLRSRLESSRTRTVERSTLQLQALIDQMPTADSTLSDRLLYFHSIPLPSKWEMEKELAIRFLSLGVVKSALEIFETLEMWEEVVKCYGALERPEKGIAIVRDLLEGRKAEAEAVLSRGKATSVRRKQVQDTAREAKLWCLLGDLEPAHAVEHYERAWKVSGETSGRAMRSLGGYYFARANYPQAISCLKRAVAINPLLARSWFILGCACMRVEDWEGGRDAFSRCVAIDDEDGESWNNLASMYLRMGSDKKEVKALISESNQNDEDEEKKEGDSASTLAYTNEVGKAIPFTNKMLAFRALKQGLRFSYDNWRMWYNYMIVAIDVGELSEAARALGRVIEETAEKAGAAAVDEDVLERLVDAVARAPADPQQAVESGEAEYAVRNPNEGHGLLRNVESLFERTILPRVSSTRIFRAYARLLTWQGRWEDALKAYLDGYRCSTAGTMEKGETDVIRWQEAVNEVEEIVDMLTNFGPRVEGYKWRLQGRSIVRTFIGRTRDFEDEPEWERLMRLQEELRKEE